MNYVCINKTKKYIEEHFTEDISLNEISKVIGYSKYHLNRMFFESTGKTIFKYIKERRLSEAAEQLSDTDKSIIEIALSVGYTSQQSFTLAFKQVYECTPQIYRKRNIVCRYSDKGIKYFVPGNTRGSNIQLLSGVMAA